MNTKAFTLIELLVVIAILAVLAVAVTLILNPAELIRQGRDSIRLSDLATINKALGLYQTDQIAKWMGTSTIVYTSLPDTDSTCSSYGLPSLPSGWTYNCETTTTYTNVDGTGWLPVDFTSMSFSSPLARLPLDPVNNATSSKYYTYVTGGSWELSAVMEAVSNKLGGDNDRVSKDGGDSYSFYELGSDVNLSPINDDGLVGYWQFDEGTGLSASDSSGNGNNGTITGASWSTSCIYGNCLSFDGSGDKVNYGDDGSLGMGTNDFTINLWLKTGSDNFYFYQRNNGGWGIGEVGYMCRIVSNTGYFNIGDGTGWQHYVVGNTVLNVQDNTWHHFVISYSRDLINPKVYVDGIEKTGSITGDNLNTIGDISYDTDLSIPAVNFNGLMDDVRIYNRALSAAEIQAIYNSY